VAAGALAVPAGVGAAVLLVTGDRVRYPLAEAGLTVLAAWAFVGGGLVAWIRRPSNRIGPLMVLDGLFLLAGSLTASGDPVGFTVGQVATPLSEAVFVQLLLAFPSGRLGSRAERAVVGVAYLDATLGQLLMLLFMDYRSVRGCPCPRNLLFTGHAPALHGFLMTAQRVVALLVVVAIVVILSRRWWTASPPLRRALAPVLSTGTLAAVLSGVAVLLVQVSDSASDRAPDVASLVATLAVAFVPLGFLVGLLRSRLARAAIGELVLRLSRPMAPGELAGALAQVVGDPSLELVYRRPDSDAYVDLTGALVDLPNEPARRAVSYVVREGRTIAAALHDPALQHDPELIDIACAAAGLALDNERLHADLQARLVDLRSSRARLVNATESERKRIERDLHDGTQQRLVAMGMTLGLLDARLPDDAADMRPLVEETRAALAATLSELRDLTQGIYPTVLTERGLGAALEELCRRAAIPTRLDLAADVELDGRLSAGVETAAYYVVSEALTNAAKHSGAAEARVTVRRLEQQLLVVEVADDGAGGAEVGSGTGLRGLADRVEALGGRLTVVSPPGDGTVLTVELPCES
jgi:signal transduction histidine kinase